MLEKLKTIELRYQEIEQRLLDNNTYADMDAVTRLTREQKELEPVVKSYRAYLKNVAMEKEARELLKDPEMKDLAQEELNTAMEEQKRLFQQMRILLLPTDPDDRKSVVLEIRQGVGGDEAALFASDILRMYQMYAQRKEWTLDIVNCNYTELGGVKELISTVEGENVYSRLKFESGTHCVKRVPETESGGRIHTSTATVAIMPEAEEVEFSIDPKELQIDTFRSSGAGGQHINKTESAIRITHIPTGTVVECQDERSQYKNKDRAMKILRSRLYEAEKERRAAEEAQTRRSQVGGAERSEKIRTYRFHEKIVVDHRLSGEEKSFPIGDILNGDLDPIVDALTVNEQAKLLQQQSEI